MAARTFPSYLLYKDNAGYYRWSYAASNGLIIAVSSESYVAKSDCQRGIDIMKASYNSPVFEDTGAYA